MYLATTNIFYILNVYGAFVTQDNKKKTTKNGVIQMSQ